MNFLQIVEGWRNNLIPKEEMKAQIQRLSKSRLEICNNCPQHSKNHRTLRPDAHCISCGCTLSAKTKCLSCSCPLSKWGAVTTDELDSEISKFINGKES